MDVTILEDAKIHYTNSAAVRALYDALQQENFADSVSMESFHQFIYVKCIPFSTGVLADVNDFSSSDISRFIAALRAMQTRSKVRVDSTL